MFCVFCGMKIDNEVTSCPKCGRVLFRGNSTAPQTKPATVSSPVARPLISDPMTQPPNSMPQPPNSMPQRPNSMPQPPNSMPQPANPMPKGTYTAPQPPAPAQKRSKKVMVLLGIAVLALVLLAKPILGLFGGSGGNNNPISGGNSGTFSANASLSELSSSVFTSGKKTYFFLAQSTYSYSLEDSAKSKPEKMESKYSVPIVQVGNHVFFLQTPDGKYDAVLNSISLKDEKATVYEDIKGSFLRTDGQYLYVASYVENNMYNLSQIDPKTMKVKEVFELEGLQGYYFMILGDTIYYTGRTTVKSGNSDPDQDRFFTTVNMKNGNRGEIAFPEKEWFYDICGNSKALFFNDKYKVYTMKPGASEYKVLYDFGESRIYNLYLDGDYLYMYLSDGDYGDCFARLKTDGSKLQKIPFENIGDTYTIINGWYCNRNEAFLIKGDKIVERVQMIFSFERGMREPVREILEKPIALEDIKQK